MAYAPMAVVKVAAKHVAVAAGAGGAAVVSAAIGRQRANASGPRRMPPRVRSKVRDRRPTTHAASNVRSGRSGRVNAAAVVAASAAIAVIAAKVWSAHRGRNAASRNVLTRRLMAATSNVRAANHGRRVNRVLTVDRTAAHGRTRLPGQVMCRAHRRTARPRQ